MSIGKWVLGFALALPMAATFGQDEPETIDPSRALTLEDLRTFTDVFHEIRDHFVEPQDEHDLLMAAIEGMVATLDPWSDFMSADEFRAFDDGAAGRYGGIGVNIAIRDRRLVIEHVNPLGPAHEAGIRAGDRILAVDEVPVRGRRLRESMDALLGEPGSVVTVEVQTRGDTARSLTLERRYIDVASVFSAVRDDVALLRISHFTRQTDREFKGVLDAVRAEHAAPLRGLVIDLRGNPGGVVQSAVALADGFLEDGLIVYTQSRYRPTRLEIHAERGDWLDGQNIVVLVDAHTASAAEVLAGALRDRKRAIVAGEKTFGKGSIQSIFHLRNGSALKLTTAHYYTPGGAIIHDHGIEPDVSLDMGGSAGTIAAPGEDPVIAAAIELIEQG